MASIEQRTNTTYRITVSCGYDAKGKKLRKYKTVKLPEGLTERQREKELNKQAVLFEKEVENGTFLDGEKITFAEFANKWITDYAEKQLAPKTVSRYEDLLKRIDIGIGHIKLSKLQPQHLMEFYNNLEEGGIRLDGKYKLNTQYTHTILENKKSLAAKTNLNARTISDIGIGKNTLPHIAAEICKALDLPLEKTFAKSIVEKGLSPKTINDYPFSS